LLCDKGLVKNLAAPVKILARGEISKALTVQAHQFSQSAKAKIEKAGGKAEEI
ncbi:MAG TPA: uL15m family ribosomal protein, partial [Candidatus Ozemobacteraceae bacterium]|nr:uL15m family ribosomal protein [Candidatus Ozemobacteraceae bacterium]